MEEYHDEVEKIKQFLKKDARGMNIREISDGLKINRNSVAKYLDTMTAQEEVECRVFGKSKVYYLSQRLPISDLMKYSSKPFLVLNQDLTIIQVNEAFLRFAGIMKDEILHLPFATVLAGRLPCDEIAAQVRQALTCKEITSEISLNAAQGPLFYQMNLIPTRFKDNSCGVVLVLEDITMRKRVEQALLDSEKKYRHLIEHSSEVMYSLDPRGIITYISPQVSRYGFAAEEVTGQQLYTFVQPDDRARVMQAFSRFGDTDERVIASFIVPTPKAGNVWVESSGIAQKDAAGTITGIYGILRDITSEKKALIALQESEEKFRVLAESSPVAIVVYQGNRQVYVNNFVTRKMGYTRDELCVMNFWDLVHPDDREMIQKCGLARQRGEDIPVRYEARFITKSGEVLWGDLSAGQILYEGKPACVVMLVDISERKAAEKALRESEEKFRVLAGSSPVAIFVYQGNRIIYANDFAIRHTGYSREELDAMNLSGLVHPNFRASVIEKLKARERGSTEPERYNLMYVTREGEARWGDLSAGSIMYGGNPAGVAMLFDITDRKRVEGDLLTSREMYRSVVENARDGIIITQDGVFRYVNPRILSITGYREDELLRQPFISQVHPGDRNAVASRAQSLLLGESGLEDFPYRILTKQGACLWVDSRSVRIDWENRPALLTFLTDVTRRTEAELALRQSENRYRAIFESSLNPMIVVEDDMTISLINRAYEESSGYSRDEIEGKRKWTEFVIDNKDLEKMKQFHRKRRDNPGSVPRSYMTVLLDRFGVWRNVILTVTLFPDTRQSLVIMADDPGAGDGACQAPGNPEK
ncbi:MAG: PAS domain S-box protein [Methanomicrobiales archaeon]|nr:PAS domain S-box protein [Methanomicrobiales archaeon]